MDNPGSTRGQWVGQSSHTRDAEKWRALAQLAGKALGVVSVTLEGHGDACGECPLCDAKVETDIALVTLRRAGLEVG